MHRLWQAATRVVERRPLSTSATVSTLAATAFFLEPGHNVITNATLVPSNSDIGKQSMSHSQALAMGAITGVPDGIFFGFWYPTLDKAVKLAVRSVPGVVVAKTAAELALGSCADRYGTVLNQAGIMVEATTVPTTTAEAQELSKRQDACKKLASLAVAAPFHAAMFAVVPVPWQAIAGSLSVVLWGGIPAMGIVYRVLEVKMESLFNRVLKDDE